MLSKLTKAILDETISFSYAITGILTFLKEEKHASFHILGAVLAIAFGLSLNISRIEWCFITFAIGIVFTSEIFNSAIERLVDLSSPGFHPLAKKAKDFAAGGVLIASILASVVGALIFIPYLLRIIR